MSEQDPFAVVNQPPPLRGFNLYETDPVLCEWVERGGAGWAQPELRSLGAAAGSHETMVLGFDANRHPPELRAFDRYGNRIDEVRYHPAYHGLMELAVGHRVHAIAWQGAPDGGHLAHAALEYLLGQAEQGVCCPVTMTYASVPVLRGDAGPARQWEPGILSSRYDPRPLPPGQKEGLMVGMAMTERQGGSDVRSNATYAEPLTARADEVEYRLHGHKWFCSAPMSDGFLTLARAGGELTCFLVPRWLPDGSRNAIRIQRLKDKLGNRSNASAEIEYHGARAWCIGEVGRGVSTIIRMVHHTRLDASVAPVAMMRQALLEAVHHCTHRRAFGRTLREQPQMCCVLADLGVEWEAGLALVMRVARAFDLAGEDPGQRAFARIAVAVAKFWLNKRAVPFVAEAMECLGGGGYVEESVLPRLYREAPVNGIWEGSGNVICLDVLRALRHEPLCAEVIMDELGRAGGLHPALDRHVDLLARALRDGMQDEYRARWLTGQLARALSAALLLRYAPEPVARAYCETRLGMGAPAVFGVLPEGTDCEAIIDRATGMIPA